MFWDEGNEGGYDEDYYYMPGYRWDERDNPCRSITRASAPSAKHSSIDLSLMAKSGSDGELIIFTNDLKSTKPTSGIELEFYDYQQQLLGTAKTDNDGKATFKPSHSGEGARVSQNALLLSLPSKALCATICAERWRIAQHEWLWCIKGEYVNRLKGFVWRAWRVAARFVVLNLSLEDKSKTLRLRIRWYLNCKIRSGVVTNRHMKSSSENAFYFFVHLQVAMPNRQLAGAREKLAEQDFTQTVKIERWNRIGQNQPEFRNGTFERPDVTATFSRKGCTGAPGKSEYPVWVHKNKCRHTFQTVWGLCLRDVGE